MLPFPRVLAMALIVLVAGTTACGRAGPQLNNEGNRAFENEEYEAALQAYEQARDQDPDLAQPPYNSGNAHYRRDAFLDAEDSYMQALVKADEGLTQQGLFNLGNAYYNTESFDEAIESYKEALRLSPDDADAKYNLELALLQLQQQQAQPDEQEQGEQGEGDQQGGDGEQDREEPSGEQEAQPQAAPLTEEQARQLLERVGESTQTLQERLQEIYVVTRPAPERDW